MWALARSARAWFRDCPGRHPVGTTAALLGTALLARYTIMRVVLPAYLGFWGSRAEAVSGLALLAVSAVGIGAFIGYIVMLPRALRHRGVRGWRLSLLFAVGLAFGWAIMIF